MQLSKIMAVFRNEWRQTFSIGRLIGWLLVTAFPILLIFLVIQTGVIDRSRSEWWCLWLFYVCEIICLLQLLIWAVPWLQSELESLSWTYLSVRPGGKTAVLIGKYLAASTRTMVGVVSALLVSMLLIWLLADESDEVGSQVSKWGLAAFFVLAAVITMSCFTYAAIFMFLGTLFPKRAMVMAVGYSLVIEFLVSQIPAMINQVSIQFRVRAIMNAWMKWFEISGSWNPPSGAEDTSVWLHLLVLLCINLGLLFLANLVACRREHVAISGS